ncbi:MAG: hypothetical protein RQ741_10735 [Wenzhouxiangellaceae bacterium]|nr:hypothetical protein [Wenzhouxiangellaceae bacterium]
MTGKPNASRPNRGPWRSPISGTIVGIAIAIAVLVLASIWLVPIRDARLFLVELDARPACDQLMPLVGSATDRFELTGASWLGGESESGYCVVAANVTGYRAMAAVSETRVIQFLRDQAGMPRASLSKTIILEDRQGVGIR